MGLHPSHAHSSPRPGNMIGTENDLDYEETYYGVGSRDTCQVTCDTCNATLEIHLFYNVFCCCCCCCLFEEYHCYSVRVYIRYNVRHIVYI